MRKEVTQKFKTFKKHEGIDISSSKNTPIYATARGKVIISGSSQNLKLQSTCFFILKAE